VTVAGFVPDLMDRSRITGAGASVTWVSTPAELVGTAADLVIVDLSRPGVLEFLPRINRRVVGFASHVDRELLAAAREAGCDQVLTRSAFFSRLPEIVVRAD
jgi:DNA-binding NarL/FixJ family response regulator